MTIASTKPSSLHLSSYFHHLFSSSFHFSSTSLHSSSSSKKACPILSFPRPRGTRQKGVDRFLLFLDPEVRGKGLHLYLHELARCPDEWDIAVVCPFGKLWEGGHNL